VSTPSAGDALAPERKQGSPPPPAPSLQLSLRALTRGRRRQPPGKQALRRDGQGAAPEGEAAAGRRRRKGRTPSKTQWRERGAPAPGEGVGKAGGAGEEEAAFTDALTEEELRKVSLVHARRELHRFCH